MTGELVPRVGLGGFAAAYSAFRLTAVGAHLSRVASKPLKSLVADAVAVERVSAAKFPANREKNRDLSNRGFGSCRDRE
jgi:hypothetical protein